MFFKKKLFIFKKNIGVATLTLIATVINALTNWGQISVISKFFNLDILGVFTFSLSIINPLFQFFSLQLRTIYVSERENNYPFESYFILRVITNIVFAFIGLFIAFFIFKSKDQQFLLILILFSYIIDSFFDIFNARFHYLRKFHLFSLSIIIRSTLSFFIFFILIYFLKSLIGALIGLILSKAISFFLFDKKYLDFQKVDYFNFTNLNIILKLGLPLGAALLISSLNLNIPKYFIASKFGLQSQGVYSTFSYIIVIGNLIISVVANLILPTLAKLYSEKRINKFFNLTIYLNAFSLLIGLILYLLTLRFSGPIIKLFFSENLLAYSAFLSPIFLTAIVSYLNAALGFSMIVAKLNSKVFFIGLISLFFNFTVPYVFIDYLSIDDLVYISGSIFFMQYIFSWFLLFTYKYE